MGELAKNMAANNMVIDTNSHGCGGHAADAAKIDARDLSNRRLAAKHNRMRVKPVLSQLRNAWAQLKYSFVQKWEKHT